MSFKLLLSVLRYYQHEDLEFYRDKLVKSIPKTAIITPKAPQMIHPCFC